MASTVLAASAAAGASIVIERPEGRLTRACGNSGAPSARRGVDGAAGYIPSAPMTHHEAISPPSSLPG